MIATDRNALICDLAETYQIYDYRRLPARLVATLAAGLRDDARIKQKITGVSASQEVLLLSAIADRLGLILYAMCGGRGDAPESLVDKFYKAEKQKAVDGFDSPEAFKAAWNRITGG